jgi:transglutaminase-like putative cysteine protease
MTAPAQVAAPPAGLGGSRRTLRALLASALGVLPLSELFTDVRWLPEIWLAMVITIAPAAILRRQHPPRVWHTWLGLALTVIWLTARYVPSHAVAGLMPTAGTWHDVNTLFSQLHDTTSNGVAPVPTTIAIKFVLAAVLALLAALVDFIAVVGRRGALAGVPLLVVYTVSGAVPRHPVSWLYFAGAAVGFLLLLSIDADDEVKSWGRLIPRSGDSRPVAGLGVSGPRIAAVALAAALVLPFLAPSRPANLIADALHNKHGSGGGGLGGNFGAGGVSLDPFDALRGDLQRPKPVNLFTVDLSTAPAAEPFYLRANVLMNYTDKGWSPLRHGGTENIGDTQFGTVPSVAARPTVNFGARIQITGLSDNPPIFDQPVSVDGVAGDTNWSSEDSLLVGSRVHQGQQITEQVAQEAPTVAELRAASSTDYPASVLAAKRVPASMPKMVTDLVTRLTRGQTTPYDKARALTDYFTDPVNGYTYSVATKGGNSGSDLVDFLTNKVGYCQQYSAAMGIMLRMAGVPTRVVLGYTHAVANRSGQFTVTTDDAHSWVEAYFDGLGWIPFDPTPLAGIDGGSKADLPWAPHPQSNGGTGPIPTASRTLAPRAPARASAVPASSTGGSHHGGPIVSGAVLWVALVLALAVLLALVPAATRRRRRGQRLRAADNGDPDPLWAELSDTAVDLGYVWSTSRTPRQVVGWLGGQIDAPGQQSLSTLASAVEHARYAPGGRTGERAGLVGELRTVEARLRADRSRSVRITARLLPASLGWRRPRIARPQRRRR